MLQHPSPSRPTGGARATRGGATTARDNRRYRTKIEVLRDLLEAASREPRKTRIIGMANLNQESFRRYSDLALAAGLLQVTNRYYAVTPAAKEWLRAVDGVLRKGSEVSVALTSLSRITRRPAGRGYPERPDTAEIARQLVARLAWSELGVGGALEEEPKGSLETAPHLPGSPLREVRGRSDPVRPLLSAVPARRSR